METSETATSIKAYYTNRTTVARRGERVPWSMASTASWRPQTSGAQLPKCVSNLLGPVRRNYPPRLTL